MRELFFVLFAVSVLTFSCTKDSEKDQSLTITNNEEKLDSSQNNLIVFFIPGLNTEVFSILNQDPNAQLIKRFNQIGFYAPKSYFQNFSDVNSNLTALMSGKTTLMGHLGIDKDSISSPSWVIPYHNRNYNISYVTNGLIGTNHSAALFTSEKKENNTGEMSIAEMIEKDLDFIWGMGTNQFVRRKDKRNLFEEMSVKDYDLLLSFNGKKDPKLQKIAGVFNNYSIPDSIDLITEGIIEWNKRRPKKQRGFLLIVHFRGLTELLKEDSPEALYSINDKLDLLNEYLLDDYSNSTILLINSFQNFDYEFGISEADSLSLISTSANQYNQFYNPVWAYGYKSSLFSGNYDNSDLHKKLVELLKYRGANW